MMLTKVGKSWCRNVLIYTSRRNMSDKITATAEKLTTAEKVAKMSPTELIKNVVRVSDWNKTLLVFAGKYKTKAEIPDTLPFETVDRARNSVRIKVANIMMFLTVIGCLTMVISGKKAAEAGVSVSSINEDWHREYNEKMKKEAEAQAKN